MDLRASAIWGAANTMHNPSTILINLAWFKCPVNAPNPMMQTAIVPIVIATGPIINSTSQSSEFNIMIVPARLC